MAIVEVQRRHPIYPRACVPRHCPAQVCLENLINTRNQRLTETLPFSTTVTLLIIFQFLAQFPCVDAVNLQACGTMLQDQLESQMGNTSAIPPTLRISYEECLVECGAGLGDINWQGFSQDFGAWLLPWISLMFQIPFGAERTFHCFSFTLYWRMFYGTQNQWMTCSPSSSPLDHLLSRPIPSKSHTSTHAGSLRRLWMSSIPIQNT